MDLRKLTSHDSSVVRDYVWTKFSKFNRFYYTRSARIRKCSAYYVACGGTDGMGDVVMDVYQRVFGELLDEDEALALGSRTSRPERAKLESGLWLTGRKEALEQLRETLETLKAWKRHQNHQEGEAFLARLQDAVAYVDDALLEPISFNSEFTARCRASVVSKIKDDPYDVAAQIELMVGFKEQMSLAFEAHSMDWGQVNAKLEQSFKAGVWGSASAASKMSQLGFSAEAKAAIAIGAQLDVAGELKWRHDRIGLAIAGSAEAFLGAKADASAKLSANAREGLELAFKAGAFAGFSAEATGSCAMTYDGRTLARVAATAGVTFGAGASFEASIKAPIFGPTQIKVGGKLSAGFGTSTKVDMAVHFDEVSLAASQEFRKFVYWRTMARGYQMTLMDQDARNLYYLNKSIIRLLAEVDAMSETIESYEKLSDERRPLLM